MEDDGVRMTVDVDEAGCDDFSGCVDDALGGFVNGSDFHDLVADDGDVSAIRGGVVAVDDRAVSDQNVVHTVTSKSQIVFRRILPLRSRNVSRAGKAKRRAGDYPCRVQRRKPVSLV